MDGGERAVAPAAQPHRFGSGGGVGGSEFFICFTSRPSSTSMRIPSSKSLPSPGRADKYRDPAVAAPSLSASLSRRLKSSGSVKGGQSPATIPAGGGSRRKSCAFEAAEPSSPKVTCIGQVKVKTARMKKKKTLRSASQRAGRGGGEATFRRLEERGGEGEARDGGEDRDCLPNRNQRWVHLPLGSICDALRAFGSEFSCFLPCGGGGRSHCASSTGAEREKGERTGGVAEGNGVAEKRARDGGMGSCGAALARWLMAVQESEGVKRGEMVELVVEEVDGRGMAREVRGMEVPVDAEKGGLVVKEEREGRLGGAAPLAAAACAPATAEDDGETVCVPPPNALLLMRCRSDPVRMAALATRFWGSPAAARVQVEVDEEDHEGEEEEEVADHKKEESYRHDVLKKDGEEPEKDAGQGPEGGAQAAPGSIVTETVLKEAPLAMADEEGSRICKELESEAGKMLPLLGVEEQRQQHCEGKGETDEGSGHCGEATPELDKDDPSQQDGEEAPKIEKAASEKEDAAGLARFPSLVVSTEKSELLLPAREQERAVAPAAAGEEAATKSSKPIVSSVERHGRRPSFSNEKDEGRRSSSKEREGKRHSFSTEKDARRTSSFRDKEGRRSSFSVESDFHRPSLCGEGEGRRRWSFSSERRPVLVDTTAEAAAVVMDKKRKKKKKKEGEEEPGAAREDDLVVEVRSFERPIAAAAAPAAAEEARRRGEKRDELPDCLLLMMYEPKLSMEVSRETWVCTSDFLRFRPHHHHHQPQQQPRPAMDAGAAQGEDAGDGGGAAENKAEVTAASDAVSLPHPSQSPPPPPTAPAPAAASPTPAPAPAPAPAPPPEAAKTPEKKPASAAASSPLGAPFGLTRCKSEPMRSTAKMEPDACFWKSRHRPIGAAGIGF